MSADVQAGTDLYWDPYEIDLNMDPYPAVPPAPRRGAALLQRALRLLRAEPRRRRRAGVRRLQAPHQRQVRRPRADPVGHRLAAGLLHLRGPAAAHEAPWRAVARLHPEADGRARTRSSSVLRPQCLDPLVGSDGFDFVEDFGGLVAARVIGMMLGIPESDQMAIRAHVEDNIRHSPRDEGEIDMANFEGDLYAEYIDWRMDHPSDDLMTGLLNVEFEDEHGTVRKLTREEVLTFVTLLSGAGNETTAKLIGWTGKLLSDHPDQRRRLVEDPTLIPDAIEEILRYEPPGMQNARYAIEDVEFEGGVVPADSVVVCIMASANRDDRRFPDPDRFDVRRKPTGHPHVRVRDPLLPRRRARAPPGPRRAGRGAEALPGVDGRRCQGGARSLADDAWVQDAPRRDLDGDRSGSRSRQHRRRHRRALRRPAGGAQGGCALPHRPWPIRRRHLGSGCVARRVRSQRRGARHDHVDRHDRRAGNARRDRRVRGRRPQRPRARLPAGR